MAAAREFGSVRQLKSGRWQARYRAPDGRRLAAETTFTTKRAAAAWLADRQSDIERGRWVSPEQVAAEEAGAQAAAVTISDLAELWLATIPSANHAAQSADRIRKHINAPLGDLPVAALTRQRCESWYAQLCPETPTQRRRVYSALHAMLELAIRQELIERNPLKIPGATTDTPARVPETATPAEVDDLAAAMPVELGMAVQIAGWCGLRVGEVLGLQVLDLVVDRDTAVPRAPVVRMKLQRHVVHGRGTGAMRIVPGTKSATGPVSLVVPPHLVPALWRHVADHAAPAGTAQRWLFPGRGGMPVSPPTLDRRWRQARTACGYEHLTFHDLRRTGNTVAAMAGATLGELKQRLRHKSSAAAERYIVAARGADAALAARMSQLAPGRPADAPAAAAVAVGDVEAEVERRLAERLREMGLTGE
jgi:integrase